MGAAQLIERGLCAIRGQFRFQGRLPGAAETQYRHTIADVFGPDIVINARFEPERREDGLQAIGNSRLSVTTSGLEQYLSVAQSIADQVRDGEARDALVGCSPDAEDTTALRACAETFIKVRGQQLLLGPLAEDEIRMRMDIWGEGGGPSGDFNKGLKLTLISLLMAPDFLFCVERAQPDEYRPDGNTKVLRIAAMLWHTSLHPELLWAPPTENKPSTPMPSYEQASFSKAFHNLLRA